MNHASVELVAAMRGEAPRTSLAGVERPGVDWLAACGLHMVGNEKATLAHLVGSTLNHIHWSRFEDPTPVGCTACLRLMARARGPQRTGDLLVYADHLEGVVAAHALARSLEPTCQRPTHLLPEHGVCGGLFALVGLKLAGGSSAHDGWNHRAKPGDRLVCYGCGGGVVGTDAEVALVEDALLLEPAAERARRALKVIRDAGLLVPGVAKRRAS